MEYILKKFKEAGIPAKNIEIGREYLVDNKDVSVLDNMEYCDFKQFKYPQFSKIQNVMPIENKERYNKLLLYLYKMGYSTVSGLFYSIHRFDDDNEEEKAMKTIINADKWVGHNLYSNIQSFCGKFTDVMKALELLEKDKERNKRYTQVKLKLYTSYFGDKYKGNKENDRTNLTSVTVLDEDRTMLEDYENNVLAGIVNSVSLSNEQKDKLISTLREATTKKEIATICNECNIKDFDAIYYYVAYAYVNFRVSNALKNIVCLATCISEEATVSLMEENDVRGDFAHRGEQFDDEFGISPIFILTYAIKKDKNHLLTNMYLKHKELYISEYKNAPYNKSQNMLRCISSVDKEMERKLIDEGKEDLQNKIIHDIATKTNCAVDVMEFFAGNRTKEDIYKLEKSLKQSNTFAFTNPIDATNDYIENYGFDEFTKKVLFISIFLSSGNVFCGILIRLGKKPYNEVISTERIRDIYTQLDEMDIEPTYLLKTVDYVNDTYGTSAMDRAKINDFYDRVYFKKKLENDRATYAKAFSKAGVESRLVALGIYEADFSEYKKEILDLFNDSSTIVQSALVRMFEKREEFREDIIEKLSSKKAKERELAARILVKWAKDEDINAVIKAHENEKTEKLKASFEKLLGNKLQLKSSENTEKKESTIEEIVDTLHKGNRKRTVEWAYETPFAKVHFEDGTECTDKYMQAIMLAYSAVNPAGVSSTANELANNLNKDELAIFVNELFDKWIAKGAEAKKRWVLYMASIHGGSDIVKKLNSNIKEWPLVARGAIAADAVYALALNPQPNAILIVDGLARKCKFKQVKSAAGNALAYAAKQLGISKSELEDRIVPTLDFDSNMERIFDYGTRKFKVVLLQTLELEIYDENGKKLKNMPAPGKKDDEVIAKQSNAEFKELKKQLKTVIESQSLRLNEALSVNRMWTVDKWNELFVANPIMHQFATGLVWGVYKDGVLTDTFRYMEDGTFNTVDEEEYKLDATNGLVGLVHPIELDADTVTTWREQLEDYEIKQPIKQLDREIFEVTDEEKEEVELTRYAGFVMSDYTLLGKMTKSGWYKGAPQDAGCFYEFYREDGEYGVQLDFEGCYVSAYGEEVTVYATRFYKTENFTYMKDWLTNDKATKLGEIPKRYFSEIVLQLKELTASCEERNPNWKK